MAEYKVNFHTGTEQEKKDILSVDTKILNEQSFRIFDFREKNKTVMFLTEENNATATIINCYKFAKELLEATVDDFDIMSPISDYLLNRADHPARIAEFFLQHKLSPYVELYSEFFSKITKEPAWSQNNSKDPIKIRKLNLIKRQTMAMREKFESADFKKKVKGVQRSVNKNHQNLLEYYHSLFKRDKTLLVLRLNLGYCDEEYKRQDARALVAGYRGLNPLSNTAINPSIPNTQQLIPCQLQGFSLQDVVLHREELIRHLRTTLKQKLRGYTWKLEYTQYKGYQYHVVIFLDATLAQAKMPYDKAIGKHWEDVITQGHGLCYSQEENKESYRFCATGVKNQADPDLPDGLAKMADYLTRPDLYIQLVLPDNQRTLGKGGITTKSETKVPRNRK